MERRRRKIQFSLLNMILSRWNGKILLLCMIDERLRNGRRGFVCIFRVRKKIWYVCSIYPAEVEPRQPLPPLSLVLGRLNKKWCENCFLSHSYSSYSFIISYQIELFSFLWMKTSCGKIRSSLVWLNVAKLHSNAREFHFITVKRLKEKFFRYLSNQNC